MDVEILWLSMYNENIKGKIPLKVSENAKEDKNITYILKNITSYYNVFKNDFAITSIHTKHN